MPKVSVIIPIYGVEKYIEQCARSLFEQTLCDMEYLFIDDCTPDGSIEVLKHVLDEYPQRKGRVIIHRMEQNSGQAKVREWGIKHATGEYIIHCDSDDWVDTVMYETLYNKAINEKADMVFCDYYINTDTSETIFQRNSLNYNNKNEVVRCSLIRELLNPVWGVLVRKELYEKVLVPTGSQSEDKTYIIQLVYLCNKISYCSSAFYHYRFHQNSICRSKDLKSILKKYNDIEQNRSIIKEFAEEYDITKIFPQELQAYFFMAKYILNGYLSNEECRKLWVTSFPFSNNKIMLNPFVAPMDKIKYILLRIRIMLG